MGSPEYYKTEIKRSMTWTICYPSPSPLVSPKGFTSRGVVALDVHIMHASLGVKEHANSERWMGSFSVIYIYCRFLIIWQASISTDILRCMWVVCTYWFCTTRPQLNQRKWHFASCHGLDWNISYILPYCRCMSVSETTFTLVGVCFLSACAVTSC